MDKAVVNMAHQVVYLTRGVLTIGMFGSESFHGSLVREKWMEPSRTRVHSNRLNAFGFCLLPTLTTPEDAWVLTEGTEAIGS
ncbi:hypothetical protein Slin_6112 [Spirosoma linguale DSM 74]|uniref:Uncharacterized protein n=1 Tax=Spirosoma linguale (strain ATCC 33905 / DSM 74 / LMG 10896 / Claus 1) TaxID=504472 RepID=D2QTE2_SPILD|nr:hypothetical protein Slin_6112 [Spirosoma linguale DSM 74]